jgi:DNA-binding response OmpR family regulator
MLPKLNGLEILRRIREIGSDVHVLILTAKDTTEDRVRGLDCGADDYLIKPFDFQELMARVRALVRRKYAAKSPTMRIGNIDIDMAARVVRRDGQLVPLSAREYALLEYLAARAGSVVSRTEIWEHLYEFDAPAESNVIDVFIGHLRKKLERPGKHLIKTRRGQGYLLEKEE